MPFTSQRSVFLLVTILVSGCSNYRHKDYQGEWAPDSITSYDFSDNAVDAPVLCFATTAYRAVGVPVHRLLLAPNVGDKLIPGAGRASSLDLSSKQALQFVPGKHSLSWCWASMNALSTGGAVYDFGSHDVEFRAGQRYVVDCSTRDHISGRTDREILTTSINYFIRNLGTDEVIYRLLMYGWHNDQHASSRIV